MRILIIKTSSLGDIVQTFPALAFLRKKFPAAQIDWVVEEPFADLVKTHPYIDNAYCIKTKNWRKSLIAGFQEMLQFRQTLREVSYDLLFDFQSNFKSALVTLQAKAKDKVGYGRKTVHEWPNLLATNKRFDYPPGLNIRGDLLYLPQAYFNDFSSFTDEGISLKVTPQQEDEITQILQQPELQEGKQMLVCPAAFWKNKQLPKETLEKFLQLLTKHHSAKLLLAWGNKQELELAEQLHKQFPSESIVIPRLALPALQNLMSRVSLVIAMDSLPLHLAGTTATPTLSFFGPSSAAKYKPLSDKHLAIQGSCPFGRTFEKRCPILRTCPTGDCIHNFSADSLYKQFNNWYNFN